MPFWDKIKGNERDNSEEKQENEPERNGSAAPFGLELLITIVEKNKAEFYMDMIQAYEVNFQFSAPARGTAKAEILNYLGITDTDKAVIFSVVREDKLDDLAYMLEQKFKTVKNGKGVAVSVPFTRMIGTSVYAFLCNAVNTLKGDE